MAEHKLISLNDYEELAYRKLSKELADYVRAGAQDEITLRLNRSDFSDITVNPRIFRDVNTRNLSTTALGTPIALPIMITPAGGQMHLHSDGELATARAADAHGTIYSTPTNSGKSLESIAKETTGPKWFQIGQHTREIQEHFVKRAEAAGYKAIILTADTPIPSRRESEIRNGFSIQDHLSWGSVEGHEDFLLSDPDLHAYIYGGSDKNQGSAGTGDKSMNWDDMEWFRSITNLPIVIKGVRHIDDAKKCVEAGFQGITISNHGARHMDGNKSSIKVLSEIAPEISDKIEVFFDSGIRRGMEIAKALSLGAQAVLIGRPLFWGLAVDGELGVFNVIDILKTELDLAIAYLGVNKVTDLDESYINL
jgi:isopentenyl diphosphate isomerase/L-lactate dehydrogenase-like FMN-dependent dehydrogenase|tara:strand:+ start:64 stop:1161 length:1098 start_codon:yes stop_codon:yes gene_type:complete